MTYTSNPRTPRPSNGGFTIVELLIVIVVIGILAAISIVAYNGIQGRARAAAATSALTQAAKKITIAQVDSTTVPDCASFYTLITSKSTDIPSSPACSFDVNNTNYQYKQTPVGSSTPTGYCMTATIGSTSYTSTNGSTPSSGSCSGHGSNGAIAITNLALNPKVASNSTGWGVRISSGGAGSSTRTAVSDLSSLGVAMTYRYTLTTAPSTYWRLGYSADIAPSKTYTFSMYGRSSVATRGQLVITWRTAAGGGASGGTPVSTPINMPAGTWQRLSITADAPSDSARAQVEFSALENGVAGVYTEGTAMMTTEGSTLYNYADGDSSGWEWSGTASGSASNGAPL